MQHQHHQMEVTADPELSSISVASIERGGAVSEAVSHTNTRPASRQQFARCQAIRESHHASPTSSHHACRVWHPAVVKTSHAGASRNARYRDAAAILDHLASGYTPRDRRQPGDSMVVPLWRIVSFGSRITTWPDILHAIGQHPVRAPLSHAVEPRTAWLARMPLPGDWNVMQAFRVFPLAELGIFAPL
jgi:hypothetical protein